MKARCSNSSNAAYPLYGGRGITVCDRWKDSFQNFLDDMGERPEGMSIDRIDNNGNYCPENCRWATGKQQCNNLRKNVWLVFEGQRHTISQWSEKIGLTRDTIIRRLQRGWTVRKTLTKQSERPTIGKSLVAW